MGFVIPDGLEPTKQNQTLQLATKKRRRSTKDDEDRPGRKRKASKPAVDDLEASKDVKKVPLRRMSTSSSKTSSKSGGRRTPKVTMLQIEEGPGSRKVSDGNTGIQSNLKTPVSAETGRAQFAEHEKTLAALAAPPELRRQPIWPVQINLPRPMPTTDSWHDGGLGRFEPQLGSLAANPLPGGSQEVFRATQRNGYGESTIKLPTPGGYPAFEVRSMNGIPSERGQQTSALNVPRSPYHNDGQGLKRKATRGDDTAFLTPPRKRRHTDDGRNEVSPADRLPKGRHGTDRDSIPARPPSTGSSPFSNPGVTPRRASSSKSGTSGAMGPPESPRSHTTPKHKPMTGKGRPSNFDPNPMQTDFTQQERVAGSYNNYRPTRLNFSPQGRPSNFSPNASPTRHDSPVGQPPILAKPVTQYDEVPRFRPSNFPKSGQQDNPLTSSDVSSNVLSQPFKPGDDNKTAHAVEGIS